MGQKMMSLVQLSKMDKTKLTVATLAEPSDENDYWRGQTPEARLEALELMRQVMYGYDPSAARVERVLIVVRLEDE